MTHDARLLLNVAAAVALLVVLVVLVSGMRLHAFLALLFAAVLLGLRSGARALGDHVHGIPAGNAAVLLNRVCAVGAAGVRCGRPLWRATMKAGVALLAGLSVLHGLVPPHPGPVIAVLRIRASGSLATMTLGRRRHNDKSTR